MPSNDDDLKALRQELKTRSMPPVNDDLTSLRQELKNRPSSSTPDKLKRIDVGHGLALLLAMTVFLCFFLAGFSEVDFSLWVDGAGVSLILYGLVRAAGWLVSEPHFAKNKPEVRKSSAEKQ